MDKERIEIVLIPAEEKREKALLPYLLKKRKLLLGFLLVGLLFGSIAVFAYYQSVKRTEMNRVQEEAAKTQEEIPAQMETILDTEFLTIKLQDASYTALNFPALARAQMVGFEEQVKHLLQKHNELFGAVGRPELTYEIGLLRQSISGLETMLRNMEEYTEITPGLLQHAGKGYLEEKIAANHAVIESAEVYLQAKEGSETYIEAQKALQPLIRETEQYKSILNGTFVDPDTEGTKAMLAQMEMYAKLIDGAKEELPSLYVKYIEEPGKAAEVAAVEAAANVGPQFSKIKAAAIFCICMAGACILWLIVALLQKEWSRMLLESKGK